MNGHAVVQRGVLHRRAGPRRRHHRRCRRGLARSPSRRSPTSGGSTAVRRRRRSIRAPVGRSARREAEADELLRAVRLVPAARRPGRAGARLREVAWPEPRSGDPAGTGRLESIVRTAAWTNRRAQAARAPGRPPGAEGSLGKLHGEPSSRQASPTCTRSIAGAARDARPGRRACSTACRRGPGVSAGGSRSPAAPTRSSATSSASASSASRRNLRSTATCPIARCCVDLRPSKRLTPPTDEPGPHL